MKDFVLKYSEEDFGSLAEPPVNTMDDDTGAGLTYTEYFQNSSEDERNLVLNLCELFNEIDFAGEKYITWDDFMSYLLDAVSDQTTKEDQIKEVRIFRRICTEKKFHSTTVRPFIRFSWNRN